MNIKLKGKLESPPPEPIIIRNTNGICELKQLRNQNPHRIIIGHLNINSIRNKFESLVSFVSNNLDIFMVSATKIDDTFPESQFLIEGFSKPFRLDRTAKGGGILLYIREDIPCKYIKQFVRGVFVELNLRRKKWLLGSSYNHHKENIASHHSNISAALEKLCADYENIILLDDFNVKVKEKNIPDFMSTYNLKSLVKQKTCFKNPDNPSCIDLILTNSPRSFQDSSMFERGFSDFHKLTIKVLKQYFPKPKPKIVNYRDYRNFRNEEFRTELDNKILKHDINNIEYQHFLNIFIEILNKYAPMKIEYFRANHGKFMTKGLLKVIMKRSIRYKTETSRKEYKRQRNFCVNLLKKTKKDHFANLDVNSVLDNRKFWQNFKPLFSNKVKAKTTIKLIENDETIDNEIKIAKIFNEYFVNNVKNLGILTEIESAAFTENNLS